MRFTAVTLIIPLQIDFQTPTVSVDPWNAILKGLTENLFPINGTQLLSLWFLLGTTALAVYWGQRLKIPVATLLCAIAVGFGLEQLFNGLPFLPQSHFSLPPALTILGQLLLGITIGEYWGLNPRLKGKTIAFASIPVALTFLTGFLCAGIAKLLTPWDWITCLLVTAPGGSPEMIWISLALNHQVEIVSTGHVVRLLAINLCLPGLISMARHLDRRADPVPHETVSQVIKNENYLLPKDKNKPDFEK